MGLHADGAASPQGVNHTPLFSECVCVCEGVLSVDILMCKKRVVVMCACTGERGCSCVDSCMCELFLLWFFDTFRRERASLCGDQILICMCVLADGE